jgi:hypothetical protein
MKKKDCHIFKFPKLIYIKILWKKYNYPHIFYKFINEMNSFNLNFNSLILIIKTKLKILILKEVIISFKSFKV